MNKKKIYISYDYEHDRHYKNLLLAWSDLNSVFDGIEIVSTNAENNDQFKKVVFDKIKQASKFLVIIGKNTHKNKWVNWEIEKANELNIPIICVKTHPEDEMPDKISSVSATWVAEFSLDLINEAINK